MDYATKHNTNLDQMLDEEALRNLYSYTYVFNIWLIILKEMHLWNFRGVFIFSALIITKKSYLYFAETQRTI